MPYAPAMRLVKIGEVARTLGYSDETIRRWEREGNFLKGGRSVGGQLVWDWAELEPWLIEHGLYHPQVSPSMYPHPTGAGPGARSRASSRERQTSQTSTVGARRRSSKEDSGSARHSPAI
jgi:predicted DNA-binding transcriptional regulator AlpA